ncbi:probable thiopurine S-methyltransferase isoform X3 [Osmerus eperlanus]|uniref:probable thiopurine S-methyltransferase isoform X3 n=1 Tax=Osmerus eperlanus TaxID=29151 RepID=UPI002E0E6C7D
MISQRNCIMVVGVSFIFCVVVSWCRTNKMLAAQADRVMALGEWEERWQEDKIGFHQPNIHPMLESNIEKVLAGRKEVSFFFPLCGKALDMKWLSDMGHSVVGVEIAEKAIKQFFEENNMTYSEEEVPVIPGAKVYKSSEGNISLYQCDLFNFSSSVAGQFGGIWDRGSLVAINPADREKYAALIMSLMAKDCRYLLDTVLYNPELYKGPPFMVPDEQVQSLFGASCDIELLHSVDALTDRQKGWGLDYLTEKVHLISPKTKLADMGHSVVGVDVVETAIKQFFEEQSLSFSEEAVPAVPGAKVYKSADGGISLYHCDIYKLSSSILGQFGGIWDRGSLVAINPGDRKKYASLMMSLMDTGCRYLLDSFFYNPDLFKGPPFFVSDEEVETLFEKCDVDLLQSCDELPRLDWSSGVFIERVHLLTPKA